MTYDPNTIVGQVRLLISDVGGQDGRSFLFTDAEISAFLKLRPTAYGAAALALRTIAGNEAQVARRITLLDLSTDGPATSSALLAVADKYEAMMDSDSDIEIAPFATNAFSRREERDAGWW